MRDFLLVEVGWLNSEVKFKTTGNSTVSQENGQLQIYLPKWIKWFHFIAFDFAIYQSCLRCSDVQQCCCACMTPRLYMAFGHPGLSHIGKIGTDVNPQHIFCF